MARVRVLKSAAGRIVNGKFVTGTAKPKSKTAKRKNLFGFGRKIKKTKARSGGGYRVIDSDRIPIHSGYLSKAEALSMAKDARRDGERGIRLIRNSKKRKPAKRKKSTAKRKRR